MRGDCDLFVSWFAGLAGCAFLRPKCFHSVRATRIFHFLRADGRESPHRTGLPRIGQFLQQFRGEVGRCEVASWRVVGDCKRLLFVGVESVATPSQGPFRNAFVSLRQYHRRIRGDNAGTWKGGFHLVETGRDLPSGLWFPRSEAVRRASVLKSRSAFVTIAASSAAFVGFVRFHFDFEAVFRRPSLSLGMGEPLFKF